MQTNKTEPIQEAQWQKTPIANLVRNTASETYYARVRVKGKLIWKSLKTDRLSVAKLRLGDFLKEENHRSEIIQSAERGKMIVGDAVAIFRQRLSEAQHLKPGAKWSERNFRCCAADGSLPTIRHIHNTARWSRRGRFRNLRFRASSLWLFETNPQKPPAHEDCGEVQPGRVIPLERCLGHRVLRAHGWNQSKRVKQQVHDDSGAHHRN